MNRMATGLCALALGLGVLTACNESRTDRMGERPGDRTPSASPPTVTTPAPPPAATTPPPSDNTTTTPSTGSPSSPSGTGTR
jgi:hypothetical protein